VPAKDQRRNQRFNLRLPFELVRLGAQHICRTGETRNLSSSGVLFTADAEVHVGEPIEFLISLPTGATLKCLGKVVRLHPSGARETRKPTVAATVERCEFVRSKIN
jgi:PilZ domain-containing protein